MVIREDIERSINYIKSQWNFLPLQLIKILRLSKMSSICKKLKNQLSVMTRFGILMSTETMLRLYKAFIHRHFHYCSMVWHFSGKQDSDNWTF